MTAIPSTIIFQLDSPLQPMTPTICLHIRLKVIFSKGKPGLSLAYSAILHDKSLYEDLEGPHAPPPSTPLTLFLQRSFLSWPSSYLPCCLCNTSGISYFHFFFSLAFFILILCVGAQRITFRSQFCHVNAGNGTPVMRLRGRCAYPLNYLAGPSLVLLSGWDLWLICCPAHLNINSTRTRVFGFVIR